MLERFNKTSHNDSGKLDRPKLPPPTTSHIIEMVWFSNCLTRLACGQRSLTPNRLLGGQVNLLGLHQKTYYWWAGNWNWWPILLHQSGWIRLLPPWRAAPKTISRIYCRSTPAAPNILRRYPHSIFLSSQDIFLISRYFLSSWDIFHLNGSLGKRCFTTTNWAIISSIILSDVFVFVCWKISTEKSMNHKPRWSKLKHSKWINLMK